jgi:hypothetical protein
MRDLGRMGENVFSFWCSSEGMTANPSNVDKEGWDFLVEFEDNKGEHGLFSDIHEAAFTSKVQVKASDSQDRKLAIKLSNLHRLATAPMPAFYVFIEFDGKDSAQKVFVRHVDEPLIRTILSRVHEIEQKGQRHLLHKKTITVHYDETHMLAEATGDALANAMRECIGGRMAEYVARKNAYLSMVGFEEGFADIVITAEGHENIERLINMSLGLAGPVDISEFITYKKRFGKRSSTPHRRDRHVKLDMPNLEPVCEGSLRCKADRLGPAFVFTAKMFSSPFNGCVPEDLRKSRIVTDFFDLIFNPFNLAQGLQLTNAPSLTLKTKKSDIRELSRHLRFLALVSTPGQRTYTEFIVDSKSLMDLEMISPGMDFNFRDEQDAIEAGLRILAFLEIPDSIQISLNQASYYSSRIIEMDTVLSSTAGAFKIQIPPSDELSKLNREWACLFFLTTPIGNIWVGVFMMIFGKPILPSDGSYTLYSTKKELVRTVVRIEGEEMKHKELITAISEIEDKYAKEYDVVLAFDKSKI